MPDLDLHVGDMIEFVYGTYSQNALVTGMLQESCRIGYRIIREDGNVTTQWLLLARVLSRAGEML